MMPTDRDDDPLSWDDVYDLTHIDDHNESDGGAGAVSSDASPGPRAPGDAGGSVQLIVYGAVGGTYLLLAAGWIITAGRDTYTIGNVLLEVMYQLGQFLAIVSPVLWFAVTMLLVRRPMRRIVSLLAGTVLLAPWPFVLTGGVG